MMPAFTSLKVTDSGVVLYDFHRLRLESAGGRSLAEFDRFAAQARPGCYRVFADPNGIRIEERGDSPLFDGMPVKLVCSPFCTDQGNWFAKPSSPSPYDAVRLSGTATLLTSTDGSEILEASTSSLIGWDGQRYIFAPTNRPRVASVSEMALRQHLPWKEQPLLVSDKMPLMMINAIKGPCAIEPLGRHAFPEAARQAVIELYSILTKRPRP